MESSKEEQLQLLLEWLKLNGVELRGCNIKYSDSSKGFGLFSSNRVSDGVLLVVPLDLAITPMRVLQDPILGPECSAMFKEGLVDDRFLMLLFLIFERLRKNSSWKPYLDILPTTFGNPLWFSEDELLELKGTTLFKATELQKKSLQSLYDNKVKNLVNKLSILDGDFEREVCFEDLLWASSIFWTRALSIPLPRSSVFPQVEEEQEAIDPSLSSPSTNHASKPELANGDNGKVNGVESHVVGVDSSSILGETVWVEGLVPGIDFCNHDLRPAATWEVDGTGSTTGVPLSMYLLSVEEAPQKEKEITISYGDKGNEELLYLYGFVMENNPDDYIMLHYPAEAIKDVPFSEAKIQLLEAQKSEMRCLLPKNLLDCGFFSNEKQTDNKCKKPEVTSYSWSGQRKTPSYLNNLVFPQEFLASLRIIAMREDDIYQVASLLEGLVDAEGERQPSDIEVRVAIWEVCGDTGALQLLVDLLSTRMMDLEEGTGTEDSDTELLEKYHCSEAVENRRSNGTNTKQELSRKKWSSIVYRQGQKQLTRRFLREAEHALQLALSETD